MPRIRLAHLLAALGAAAALGVELRAQDPAARPARLLEIDAVAFDRDGKPVTDLTSDDIEIWIGGYRVPIESITPASNASGRLIVLLLDDITIDPAATARVREIALRFVTRMLPGDRGAVVMLNGGAFEVTADPTRMRRRIESLRQSVGVMPFDQLGEQLLRTVDSVARSIVEAPERRKAIVAIGSGWLLDTPVPLPELSARDVRKEWFDALRSLAIADATYYVIDPGGVGAMRQTGATGLAREAGGHAFVNTNDFNGAVDRILRESANYYLIRVGDPPVGRKAELRDLDVRVKRRGVTVRARRSIPGRQVQ